MDWTEAQDAPAGRHQPDRRQCDRPPSALQYDHGDRRDTACDEQINADAVRFSEPAFHNLRRETKSVIKNAAAKANDQTQTEDQQTDLLDSVASACCPKQQASRKRQYEPDSVRPSTHRFTEMKPIHEHLQGGSRPGLDYRKFTTKAPRTQRQYKWKSFMLPSSLCPL